MNKLQIRNFLESEIRRLINSCNDSLPEGVKLGYREGYSSSYLDFTQSCLGEKKALRLKDEVSLLTWCFYRCFGFDTLSSVYRFFGLPFLGID